MFKSVAQISARFDAAKARKLTQWWSHMQDAYELASPERETFFYYTPGQEKTTQIYDSTAPESVTTFAGNVQAALTPPGTEWAQLVPGKESDGEQTVEYMGRSMTVAEALGEITATIFDYINKSNFYARDAEANTDLAISMGVMTCEYDFADDNLVFDTIPLSNVYIEPDKNNDIGAVYRTLVMPASLIEEKFPGATIPEDLANQAKSDPSTKAQLLWGMNKDEKTGDWWSTVLYTGKGGYPGDTGQTGSSSNADLIWSENYGPSMPYIAFRWMVVPGEYYGRGPVMEVLPEIKTLNKMGEFSLRRAGLATGGVWTGRSDGIFNPYTTRITPGTVIPVTSNSSADPSLRALDLGGDFVLQLEEMKERRRVVRSALLADEPFGEFDDPTKTLGEIHLRNQTLLQKKAVNFGRLRNEKAQPIIERVIHLLSEEGIIPPLKIDGRAIDIKYTSPVMRLQDISDVQNVDRIIENSMRLVGPEMTQMDLKLENYPSWALEKLGGDPALIRTDAEKAQVVEQAQQAAEQGMLENV